MTIKKVYILPLSYCYLGNRRPPGWLICFGVDCLSWTLHWNVYHMYGCMASFTGSSFLLPVSYGMKWKNILWKWVFTHESLIDWIFAFYNWVFVNLKSGNTYNFSPLLPGQHELFKWGYSLISLLLETLWQHFLIHH